MTPRKRFLLKNRMGLANMVSNLVGAVGVNALLAPTRVLTTRRAQELGPIIEAVFTPTVFAIAIAATLIYQRPIRRYLDQCHLEAASPAAPTDIQRRVLNEPFFGVLLDFTIWIFAAIFWAALFFYMGEPQTVVYNALISNLSIGMITCTVAFFVLEHVLQKVMVPFFFPSGRLYGVPGTIRISIRVRLAALLLACNLVPFLTQILVYARIRSAGYDAAVALERMGTHLLITSPIFIAVGLWICFLVSSNLSLPLQAIIQALKKVRAGNFDDQVPVTSNDEIGYTGDVINQMTEGLKERERLRLSMLLAREVQQNLLPAGPPDIKGLDLAGASQYCDETGGDYYDFMALAGDGCYPVGVVIGDVAGHGVSSALLMASTRAFLRQRASLAGGLDAIVSDVNCQLSLDVAASGQFMTLFMLLIDPDRGRIEWVRAGHDPAILYDPAGDRFDELTGTGLPLGIDATGAYAVQRREDLVDGTIVFLGTDGIWETFNDQGEMFGKERLFPIIRANARDSAEAIQTRILSAWQDFRGATTLEDDATLVIVKLDRKRQGTGGSRTPECHI